MAMADILEYVIFFSTVRNKNNNYFFIFLLIFLVWYEKIKWSFGYYKTGWDIGFLILHLDTDYPLRIDIRSGH